MATKVGKNENITVGAIVQMDVTGAAETARKIEDAAKANDRSLKSIRNSMDLHDRKLADLNKRYKQGKITKTEYEQVFNRLKFQENKRLARLEKERLAVSGLDKQESILERNRRNRARMAGMAASGVSGLGFGGRAAGAARFLGGAVGLGGPAAALGIGFTSIAMVKESISSFAELETKIAGLKSLFGESLGEKLTNQFRQLSKTTILTNNQLIENAKTWASYGLTTDKLTDRLRRLGTVAGGNSEKFRQLTIAFAQVNAQGKLMGQEKNQLINAGFNLQAVAEAAGITMEDFADAMKNGEITAEHLNEALIEVTSEGGIFADYLEKQAETINGKITILSASWEEFLQALGKSEKGPAMFIIDKLIHAAELLKKSADWWGGNVVAEEGNIISGNIFHKGGGVTQAGGGRPEATLLGAAGADAFIDADDKFFRETIISDMIKRSGFAMSYAEAAAKVDEQFAIMKKNAEESARLFLAQQKVDQALAEAQEKRDEERAEIEKAIFDDAMTNFDLTIEEFQNAMLQFKEGSELYKKLVEEFQTRAFTEGGAGFVGPILGSRKDQESRVDKILDDNQGKIDFERDMLEAEERKARGDHRREMDLLKAEEKMIAENLAKEKRIAAGPQQKDVSFEGGSVEEFMFLRRQTQISDEAKATKEAEDRAQRQRQEIADRRKEVDEQLATAMTGINAMLEDLNKRESLN